METTTTEVLIIGAGPVGLTLAIALGQAGVPCMIVERLKEPARFPKMERCNPRTMEHYRQMGIADRIRAASYPSSAPMDVFVVTSLSDPPLAHLRYPSVDEARRLARETNDGSHPLEPSQIISQYTLEPLLKRVAEDTPNVRVAYGHELVSFEVHDNEVSAKVKLRASDVEEEKEIRSSYLVGCDGGASTVRKQLGIKLEGDGGILDMRQALYRCDDLLEKVALRIGRGRHYHFADRWGTSLVVQDDLRHFSVHTRAPLETDFRKYLIEAAGFPIEPELLWVGPWTQHLLVAERYQDERRRVFIAGDAAHLVIPTGGLGMNTGVGDAINLAWKIAGTVHGWGGSGLLESYDTERRAIGLRNSKAAGYAASGMRTWRAAYKPDIREDTESGRATRAEVSRLAEVEQRKCHEMTGIELGHHYVDSPLIYDRHEHEVGAQRPDPDAKVYRPTSWPGARLPHVWLEDGSALHDRLKKNGFTLIRFAGEKITTTTTTDRLEAAMRSTGAPFDVVTLEGEPAATRAIFEYAALLVRPDGHVVWRGNEDPRDDATAIASAATGR